MSFLPNNINDENNLLYLIENKNGIGNENKIGNSNKNKIGKENEFKIINGNENQSCSIKFIFCLGISEVYLISICL